MKEDFKMTKMKKFMGLALAGVMAQNKRTDASKKHVWTTGAQKILGGEK